MRPLTEDTFLEKLMRFAFGAVLGALYFFALDLLHYFVVGRYPGGFGGRYHLILDAMAAVVGGIVSVRRRSTL
jgi:hypothetical protein